MPRAKLVKKIILGLFIASFGCSCLAEPVRVKYAQGALHAFMIVRSEDGKQIAVGDLDQTPQGTRVSMHLKLRFDDGSIYDETTVFTQHQVFRLVSDHLLESGPSFKEPTEVWIDCASGRVKVRDMKDAQQKIGNYRMQMPPDLANGLVSLLVENFFGEPQHTLSMIVTIPKPRVVTLNISRHQEDGFLLGTTKYKTDVYVLKVNLGGVARAVAPLVGKQPPDTRIWVLKADVPIFLKSIGPLAAGAPVWQIELASPKWPEDAK
jgi:hypothetical protein